MVPSCPTTVSGIEGLRYSAGAGACFSSPKLGSPKKLCEALWGCVRPCGAQEVPGREKVK
eukprot:16091370-Heterocapsa_arctica.AAC.1